MLRLLSHQFRKNRFSTQLHPRNHLHCGYKKLAIFSIVTQCNDSFKFGLHRRSYWKVEKMLRKTRILLLRWCTDLEVGEFISRASIASQWIHYSKETTNFACTWTIKPTLQGLSAINFKYYYKLRAHYHKNAINQSILWIFNDALKGISLQYLLFTTIVKLHMSLVPFVYYQCQIA